MSSYDPVSISLLLSLSFFLYFFTVNPFCWNSNLHHCVFVLSIRVRSLNLGSFGTRISFCPSHHLSYHTAPKAQFLSDHRVLESATQYRKIQLPLEADKSIKCRFCPPHGFPDVERNKKA